MPKVSFILPAYKRRFLKEAINSILAQTCRDFELVIVDDKSPEGLYEVIKEYPWEKGGEVLPDGGRKWDVDGISVRYYQNEENMGGKDLVAAWNHAMEYATGEWCVLAGDDDVYHADYLKEMILLQSKYSSVDIVHCRILGIGEDGETRWLGWPRAEFENGIAMIFHATVLRLEQRIGDLMFWKDALAEIGGFPYNPTAYYTDLMTAVALALKKGSACSPRFLFCFRESGENISCRFDNVDIKIEACLQYKDWIWRVIDQLKPESGDDTLMLEQIRKKETNRIYDIMWFFLARMNLIRVVGLLRRTRLERKTKLRFLKMKLERCLSSKSICRFFFYPLVVVTRPLRHKREE